MTADESEEPLRNRCRGCIVPAAALFMPWKIHIPSGAAGMRCGWPDSRTCVTCVTGRAGKAVLPGGEDMLEVIQKMITIQN